MRRPTKRTILTQAGVLVLLVVLVVIGLRSRQAAEAKRVRIGFHRFALRLVAGETIDRKLDIASRYTYEVRLRHDLDPYGLQQSLGPSPDWRGEPLLQWAVHSGGTPVAGGDVAISHALARGRADTTLGSFRGQHGGSLRLSAVVVSSVPETDGEPVSLVVLPKGSSAKSDIVAEGMYQVMSHYACRAAWVLGLGSMFGWLVWAFLPAIRKSRGRPA